MLMRDGYDEKARARGKLYLYPDIDHSHPLIKELKGSNKAGNTGRGTCSMH